ncbi:MAG: PAS domain S-box protein [Chloroflexi bacterium]|nr:PAS domain S-box protein [Chloroflexota bacterium]
MTAPAQTFEVSETSKVSESAPSFPVVGIGASAGGLAALEGFFANMPADTEGGIAFVIVQHLDPGHKSILTDLVQRYTKMQVFEVEDGMTVEPNCAYIIPPNKDMALLHDKLHLIEPAAPRGLRLPIDFFFRSLAQDRGEQAICIVLSGAGTDGTLGLRAIKEVGGMAMVQNPESAGYDGMPRSAVATGLADYVLPPKDMPKQLIGYVQHIFGRKKKGGAAIPVDVNSWIQRILVLLRSSSGHDFSCYKQSTILRRVERRMAVHQIERIEQYVQYLRQNEIEQLTLFRELLIGVTGFFRDPEAYGVLLEGAINKLLADRPVGTQLRVWTPGCSTGEEAYSIAMLFQEQMEHSGRQFNLQVFATDIDQTAIEKARVGLYPANIAADVTPERLGRFFIREGDDAFRVKKSIRDVLVFAEQDVIKDPPFSKIDLLTCRNLLIYMQAELQRKVIPIFHYALNPGGFLFLGSSESVGEFTNLFEAIDRKWKLYLRKEVAFPHGVAVEMPVHVPPAARIEAKERKVNAREVTERTLLTDYAPACVTVNSHGEILYVHGRTGKYLELTTGEMSANILRAAREGLRLELATALRKVVTGKKQIRYDGLTVKTNGDTERVNLIVKPADVFSVETGTLLVIFEPAGPTRAPARPAKGKKPTPVEEVGTRSNQHIAALERELRVKEEYLQTTVEELETANEELKSTNEELQSTNEELQSTNEELETSKEELQSVNEELVTVNTELQQKIEDLSRANNDMNNLLAGTGIGTIFLDHQQNILRFTPAVTRIIPLQASDVGRPLEHFSSNVTNVENLASDIRAVLDLLTPHEAEVQTKDGHWYLMRILPYRTLENVIEGVVLTFCEITEQKRLQEALRNTESALRLAVVLRDANDAITAHDLQGRILAWNPMAEKLYGWSEADALAMNIREIVPMDKRAESIAYAEKLARGEPVEAFETQRVTKAGQTLDVRLTVTVLVDAQGKPYAVATTERNVTT